MGRPKSEQRRGAPRAGLWLGSLAVAGLTGCAAGQTWVDRPVAPAQSAATVAQPARTEATTPERPSAVPAGPDGVRRTALADEAAARVAPPAPSASVAELKPDSSPPGSHLTLREAVGYGLRHNPRLAQEAARVGQARAGEMIAFAPFLPDVAFKYQESVFNVPVLPGGNFVPATLDAGIFSYSLAEIGTQYTLADFGRRAGAYGQAESTTRINALLLQRAREAVAFQVVDAYLQVLAAEARVRVRTEALERSRAVQQDVKSRKRQGSAETETGLVADVGVTRAEAEIVAARQAVLDARSLLNLALGRSFCGPLALTDETRRPELAQTLDEALMVALKGRDEIEVARQQVALAGFGEQAARGDYLPRLVVRAGVIRADAPKILHTWIVAAGLYAEQEIYAGGRVKGGLRRAEAVAAEAFAGLRVITDNVSNQVNLAHNAIATARERVRLGEAEVVQARESLRIHRVQYRNGGAILSEVISAETTFAAAQVNFVTAVYEYLDALARLDYAQGGDQSCLLAELERTPPAPEIHFGRPLPPLSGPLPPGIGTPAGEPDRTDAPAQPPPPPAADPDRSTLGLPAPLPGLDPAP